MNEVKLFKLINGEMLIGTVEGNGGAFIIKDYYQIGLGQNPDTGKIQKEISNLDLLFANPQEISIDKAHILYTLEPSKEIESAYRTKTSGIITDLKGINPKSLLVQD